MPVNPNNLYLRWLCDPTVCIVCLELAHLVLHINTTHIMAPPATLPETPLIRQSNKRDGGIVGSDLIINYCSDLVACDVLPSGRRYTHNGNLKAGTFLVFNAPAYILEEYPDILSSEAGEEDGIQLLLSTFSMEARLDTLEMDWEGKWFAITARVCPNRLTFESVDQDGWEEDGDMPEPVQYALALPRDDGLEP